MAFQGKSVLFTIMLNVIITAWQFLFHLVFQMETQSTSFSHGDATDHLQMEQ
jgi:hypothetical protein